MSLYFANSFFEKLGSLQNDPKHILMSALTISKNWLQVLFSRIRIIYPRSKKTLVRDNFSVVNRKIIAVPEKFVGCRTTISDYKDSISVHDHLLHVNRFELTRVGPAPFLNGIYFDVIVERAGESEPVSKNLRHQVPILFLPGGIPCLDNFSLWCIFECGCLARNSLGKSCLKR